MRIRMICLALAGGLLGSFWAAPPLAAQGCSGCTSSHSCSTSTSRGYCSWECSASGVCACADARCGTVIKPVALELHVTTAPLFVSTGGRTRLDALLVTGCDGARDAFVMVALPFGPGLARLPDSLRSAVVAVGLDGSAETGTGGEATAAGAS